MKHYKWRLILITLVLIATAVGIFHVGDEKAFLNSTTHAQIEHLKELSLNHADKLKLSEQQRNNKILDIIDSLEQHAQKSSQLASERFNEQQWSMALVVLLIFFYLSYVLLKVLKTSKHIEQSNSRIKSEIAKIQTTFASIGDAVITTNNDGEIDYMNQSAQDLTNYQLEEGSKLPIDTVFKIFNEDNFLLVNPVETAMNEQRVIKGKHNVLLQRRGGEQLPIVYTIAPIHDSDSLVIGTIIVFHDTSETHKLTKALSWQASHDALTRLPNRVLLKDKLENSLKDANDNGTLLTLFFIDLDGFKPVNDQYGHDQGDKVLKIIAQRLLDVIRNDDLVARLGGDEFVITLLSFNEQEEIINALNRVMNTISQPIPVGSANVVLSASIGVTTFPDDYSDADTLLRHADQAMYIAKQQGRNQYHFFDVHSNRLTTRREHQRQRLEQALSDDEFFLVYQPKVNMRTGDIYGFEALLRWNNPQSGIIPPDKFISICEDNELIIQIGDWVFAKAFEQLEKWHKSGLPLRIAINIAPRQFQDSNFIANLDKLLEAHPNIPSNCIELEVLESAALQDTLAVSQIIKDCHQRDISVALDDFGTGYASLSYLKQLPADQLKIDKSFIQDMLDDEGDRAIVEGIISLAKIFNRQVIAEGVESKEHGVMLLRLGCDIAQGYGISKPLEANQIPDWINSWSPDANWILWSETPWDISDFPLLIAHSDHFAGINNIIESVKHTDSNKEAFDLIAHNECRLGKWYYGIGKDKYQHFNSYQGLEKPHRNAHIIGKKMLQLAAQGKHEQANALVSELIDVRDDVLDKLNKLQAEILQQQQQ